jgi:hypothetical protein
MTIIKRHAFLLPRGTSAVRVEPAYVKPLLQIVHNSKEADKAKHVQQLKELPPGIPKKAITCDVTCEGEMQRLCAEFGVKTFRTVYPIDDMFEKAFNACAATALPNEIADVPNVERGVDDFVADILALGVPSLKKDQALALVEAGATVELLAEKIDVNALAAKSKLPVNLIRSAIEAAKGHVALDAPRGAPSAPSELRPTSIKMGSAITE